MAPGSRRSAFSECLGPLAATRHPEAASAAALEPSPLTQEAGTHLQALNMALNM
jgi:hypothetical protein